MVHEKLKKIDFVDKVKLRVGDLRVGMYVCELDRPWLETPFPLQGLEVKSDEDIHVLMDHCEYVYIDLIKTKVVQVTIDSPPPIPFLNKRGAAFVEHDLQAAESTRQQTSKLIAQFIDNIRLGQSPEIELAKETVVECVSGIMRNPESMMFLTRLHHRDKGSAQHAFNVCVYSIVLGRQLGLNGRELEVLGTCGLLHDIGEVKIPENIMNKPGKLSNDELEIVRLHTLEGQEILMSGHNLFGGVIETAVGHHENIDGSGYPRRLQGHQLSLNCKIVSVVDRYDALITQKPYRPAADHLKAMAFLNKFLKENKTDETVTNGFVSYLGIYPPGSIVSLSSGEVAIVLGSNPRQRLRPQVLVVRDPAKQPVQVFVDLAEKTTDARGRPYRIAAIHNAGEYGIEVSHYYDALIQAFK